MIPFPLYEVLNGKNTEDYLQRVEPSPSGGQKMGEALFRLAVGDGASVASTSAASMRPAQMER